MEEMEEREWGESNGEEQGLIVGVGLTGGRKSKYILKWALDKFLPENNGNGNVTFILFHVYSKITCIPTPNLDSCSSEIYEIRHKNLIEVELWVPIAQVGNDTAESYRQEIERKKKKHILPYQQILKDQKIKSKIVMLESDDIAMAISLEVERRSLRHLVIGASSTTTGLFSRKKPSTRKMLGENQNLSTVISETTPDFCSVYLIFEGKLQHTRPADSEPSTLINVEDISRLSAVSTDSSQSSSSLTIGRVLKSGASSPRYPSQAISKSVTFTAAQRKLSEFHPTNKSESKRVPRATSEIRHHTYSDTKANENASFGSQGTSTLGSWVSDPASPGGSFVITPPTSFVSSTPPTGSFVSTLPSGSFVGTPPGGGSYVGTPQSVRFVGTPSKGSFVDTPPTGSFAGTDPPLVSQLENIRTELQRIEHMYELAQNSVINEKLNDLSKQRLEEAIKLKKEKAKELARTENKLSKNAQDGAASDLGLNSPESRAERKAVREAKEDESKAKQLVAGSISQYQKFTWDEIKAATSSFSEEFKTGMGAFGTVYKCKLHHTTVAVKVLHCKNSATDKQFLQELEILSSSRHPHLLLLLGAVPEENCLVYEYMENGSLEDRLFRRDNQAPLQWYDRFRICWEVASALTFLHSTKPKPIIHRDLKPANILLDQNLVSKIGDAGLGTMLNVEPTSVSIKTRYKETSPVGTFCYIDPEYQRTGRVSTKSDVYALGVVMLQLLTAKPAVGVTYIIEDAIDEGNLMDVLDLEAGEWPKKETVDLAIIALQCAELRGRDRPDLREKILPFLEGLKEVAGRAKESASRAHFICPILNDIMEDPYVAADGYTYDRRAIEEWMTNNDTSPTTNLPLPHKFIMPNYTLLEAIRQWKSERPTK